MLLHISAPYSFQSASEGLGIGKALVACDRLAGLGKGAWPLVNLLAYDVIVLLFFIFNLSKFTIFADIIKDTFGFKYTTTAYTFDLFGK